MIKIIEEGDIFKSSCQTIVNTVNCVGVMGKGIALEFKKRYPDMFIKYKTICDNNLLDIGKLWIYKAENRWILNFPTKKHWRYNSEYSYIEQGLKKFVESYKEKGIKSIAFPMLGCNNGKLDKDKVLKIMVDMLGNCKDLEIEIYKNPLKPYI